MKAISIVQDTGKEVDRLRKKSIQKQAEVQLPKNPIPTFTPMPNLEELKRLKLIPDFVTEQDFEDKGFDLCCVAPGCPSSEDFDIRKLYKMGI